MINGSVKKKLCPFMINKQSATQRKSKEKSETKKFTTKKNLNLRVSKNVLP
jgi:hypothetical protein